MRAIRRFWLWGLRLLILWAFVSVLSPAEPRAILEETQQVETLKDHVCVHTRLIDEVFEWKIQRSLQLVGDMGADTIVEFFPWAYIQPERGRYDWQQADRIVRHAQNQGIRIIARMGFVPYWARTDRANEDTTLNYLPDESYAAFAEFVAAFAGRYAGTIDHIIIWNEPNLAFEWGYQEINPTNYVNLLRAVYQPIKAANPDVVILAGALAPTLEPTGSPHGLNDIDYLEMMYEAGAAAYFDALAIHTYGFSEAPLAPPQADTLNFRRAELLYDIVQAYDDAGTPVYITESGWNDHPRWAKAVRPAQRIRYTIGGFEYAESNWPWVEELCIWAFRYPLPTLSYPDNFTLVTTDFQMKPIFHALQAYARGAERSDELWLPAPTD